MLAAGANAIVAPMKQVISSSSREEEEDDTRDSDRSGADSDEDDDDDDDKSDDSTESEPRLAERADPSAGPEETAAATEMLRRTQEAITDLAPREQLLIRLHFVQGLEVPRVAKTLGISENATHVLKSRIRNKLKKALAAEPEGQGRDGASPGGGRHDD